MNDIDRIGNRIEALAGGAARPDDAAEMLRLGETILEAWITAHGGTPTAARREGFRLLALHRQGAGGEPSFNACRETCRELVYHYNLLATETASTDRERTAAMMALVANHLYLFIRGKLENARLGDFCCSSRPLRGDPQDRAA